MPDGTTGAAGVAVTPNMPEVVDRKPLGAEYDAEAILWSNGISTVYTGRQMMMGREPTPDDPPLTEAVWKSLIAVEGRTNV